VTTREKIAAGFLAVAFAAAVVAPLACALWRLVRGAVPS